jgi:hypothetical protein
MAVAIRGTTPATTIGVVDPTSVTLTGARQPQTGDVLIIIHCNDFYALSAMPTPTVGGSSTGVNTIVNADNGTNGAHIKSWYFVVGSTGDLTVSVDETGPADEEKGLAVYVLSGVDNGTPIDVSGSAVATGASTHIAPSVSPTSTNAFLICHASVGGGTAPASYTSPGSMSEQYDSAITAFIMVGATEQLSASGATGTRTFTPNTGEVNNAEISIAVKTASAAAADSSTYSTPMLPGRIGPDGRVFMPLLIGNGAATSTTTAPAGDAAATGTALQPTAALGANAGISSAAGSGLQPAGGLGAKAGVASATGTALQPVAGLGVNTGVASAAGTAPQPVAALGVIAGVASVAGSALQPTVATSGSASAPAGLAAGAGTALQPVSAIGARAGLASVAGTAPAPAAATTAKPAAPTAAASALAATIQTGKIALAGVASAVGSALAAVAKLTARPSAPTAAGTALEPATTAAVVANLRTLTLYSTRQFGADGYRVGENQVVWLPTNLRAGAPLLVVCHGTAAQASWYSESSERYRPLEAIANTGIVVIAGDLGEPANADGWGNDLSRARVWEVVTWAGTQFGCSTTKIHLRGESAGGATALNAARERPTQTGSVHLAAGVCDIEAIYQGGAGNSILVNLIDLAYTVGGGWPAQRATHDPALNTGDLVPLADRIRCYYTSGDGLVPPQATIDFAAAVGCGLIPVGDMPHSDAVLTAIQSGDLASWIWDLHT